jgi:N-acetylneuraminic acid mutarotase
MRAMMLKALILILGLASLPLCSAELGKVELASIMPRRFFCHQSVVLKDKLYVIGGHGSGRRIDDVWFSKISADGQLSPWQKTTPLPPGKFGTLGHSVTVYKGFIYNLGGTYKDEADKGKWKPTNTVVFGKAGDDGNIAEWKETSPLPEAQKYGSAVAGEGYLYYISGEKSRQVYFAKIKDNGELEAWKVTRNLISPRRGAKAFYYDGYLYIIGGEIIYRKYSDIVFRAKVNEDGSISKWRRSEPLPEKLAGFGAVLAGKNVFTFGGAPQTSVIYGSSLDKEDHFEEWRKLGSLPVLGGVSSLQAANYGDYIFVIGGITIGPPNMVYNTVLRYKIIEKTNKEKE